MKTPTFPLVSICIPIYNGEAFLAKALASVTTQTYPNLEVVVSDDRSSDASLAIVEQFQQEVDFPVRIFSHEPQGIGANWNHCVAKAKGQYIKFLFQDDVLLPTCVEKMVEAFQQFPEVGLVACKRDFILNKEKDEATERWLKSFGDLQAHLEGDDQNLLFLDHRIYGRKDFLKSPKNIVGEPTTVMFSRNIINKIGWFREDFKQSLDYEFYYRVLVFSQILILPEVLVQFRLHEKQATEVNRSNKILDYDLYPEIVYQSYKKFLHPEVRKELWRKYSVTGRIITKFGL
ncbi:glycosyltransferase family 2 protein [Mesonia mobilis]|nr:glycosyltransferase [Mesonia mobilis]MBQ0738147.1 glycosyltransferase [Aquimarina celericrescens]